MTTNPAQPAEPGRPADDRAMTVLVVGATGSIGRHVVDALLERGDLVLALTRPGSGRRVPAGAEVVEGDIADPASLKKLDLPHVDAVVFTHGSHGGARDAEQVDYGAVANVLDVLGDRPARIALMTSIGVTGDRYAPHVWKRRGEQLVRTSGRPYTIVRPGWFDYNQPDEHRLVFLQGDRRRAGNPSDGVIARRQIADVLVGSLHSPAAERKTLELVAETGPAQTDLEPLFAALEPDPAGSLDGVLDTNVKPLAQEPAVVRDRLAALRP